MNHWVDSIMASITLEEQIGQLFMLVIDPNPRPGTVKIISGHIREYHIGGILFGRGSPGNQVISTNTYQEVADIPLMIALDGEYGLAMRLSPAVAFPKTMTLGAIQDERFLEQYGQEIARECREMGIHINFAPVLDISSKSTISSLGIRSFGENPQRISKNANAFARGLEKGRIMVVAKHFPGHGYAVGDTHDVTAQVNLNRKELEEKNLFPFRSYINEGFSGIMSGHFYIPALDSISRLPSSLSPVIMTTLLKEQMGFSGLVFTDALVMRGAGPGKNVCVQALLAGNDVLVSPPDIQKDFYAVKNAVSQGIIPLEMIESKCRKVLEYKYILGLSEYRPVKEENLLERILTPYAEQLAIELYEQAITLLKHKRDVLPLKKDPAVRTALVIIGTPAGKNTLLPFFSQCHLLRENPGKQDLLYIKERIKSVDNVFYCIYTHHIAGEDLLDLINNNKNNILCFFQPPYSLIRFENIINRADAVLVAYENTVFTHEALSRILRADSSFKGKLPVSISE